VLGIDELRMRQVALEPMPTLRESLVLEQARRMPSSLE
jgi:hypothetical protein